MSNPYEPGRSGWEGANSEPPTYQYPGPAYGGQDRGYGSGYQSPPGAPYGAPPSAGGEPPAPTPPKSPKWLWLLAGVAVLLVVGLVAALFLADGSSDKTATGTTASAAPSGRAGSTSSRAPTTSKKSSSEPSSTSTSPSESSEPGTDETVAYSVTGTGKAISIVYTESDGVVQTAFNVELPWSKEVTLSSSTPATLTIATLGDEVTCTITVNGEQVSQRTGSVLTVCTSTE